MMDKGLVKRWLDTCGKNTRNVYQPYFKLFEEYVGKSGEEMLVEHRKYMRMGNPETMDIYAEKLFQFYKWLLSGEVKRKLQGSIKGKSGGWTGKYVEKPLSQNTCRNAVAAVKAFFSFYNMPLNFRKFLKKDARMRKPRVMAKKHLLLASEIEALFKVASLRDKVILSLGLAAGCDESSIANLRIEQFDEKLNGTQLELIQGVRPKTNEDLTLLLTVESQQILKAYITSLDRKSGPLFLGYHDKLSHHDKPIQAKLCNDVFRTLCRQVGIKPQNEKRLTFHCLRMWFSTVLRNKISDDIIDVLTGHTVRYAGAYIGDEKLRELLTEAKIEDLLRLQATTENGTLKSKLFELESKIKTQDKTMSELKESIAILKIFTDGKVTLDEDTNFTAEQKNAIKSVDDIVKLYNLLKSDAPKKSE